MVPGRNGQPQDGFVQMIRRVPFSLPETRTSYLTSSGNLVGHSYNHFQHICAQPEAINSSPEELRFEYYNHFSQDRGPSQQSESESQKSQYFKVDGQEFTESRIVGGEQHIKADRTQEPALSGA